MLLRIYAIFQARNREFMRDRGTLAWNLVLPVALMFGLSFAFSNDRDAYTVGVLQESAEIDTAVHPFLATSYINFVIYDDLDLATRKIERHQLDLLVEFGDAPKYWVNSDSPKGYFAEIALLHSVSGSDGPIDKQQITGEAVSYADWLLPGILGMNMMFSCLFGVGYVVVRYRKLVLTLLITSFIYAGTHLILDTRMDGSYLTLFLIAVVGAISLVSLGLVVSARVTSEELAGGLLNLINWPMMMLSGVWFSLEGAPEAVRMAANIFPLTHVLNSARAVMLDGATLLDVAPSLLALTAISIVFFAIGARIFRWSQD